MNNKLLRQQLRDYGCDLIGKIRSLNNDLVDGGVTASAAEQCAMDTYVTNNCDLASLLFASGLIGDAYSAVYEELTDHIFGGNE